MIKRIGLLTSGGDCQALNATMRGVVKGLTNSVNELEVYGFGEVADPDASIQKPLDLVDLLQIKTFD